MKCLAVKTVADYWRFFERLSFMRLLISGYYFSIPEITDEK
jgi:hypothetical protein